MTHTERFQRGPKRKFRTAYALLAVLSALASISAGPAHAQDFSHVPVKGMVTLLDLGADQCVPCKMMAPILTKLQKDYKDKAAIIFIDVWKNPEESRRFAIRAIPTQIFFDPNGNEVYRHMGFMGEKAIVEQLTKMGAK